ncbi:MAG: hypothetical protein JSS57_11565 [Proteobacteria bacterium]|nr:hypothetical protein [Pseudomonadota bacterium]RTL32713.1 MAG: hypothetical protein EKK49_10630 [Rhodocyclaceae bacterium]
MSHAHENLNARTTAGFQFTFTDGQVTGIGLEYGTHTHSLTIPSNTTFTVTDGVITETLTKPWGTDTIQYTQDANDATLYHITSETHTIAEPDTTDSQGHLHGYTFTISDGAVTGVQVVTGTTKDDDDDGKTITHNREILPGQHFTLNADGSVTETTLSGSTVKTIQFVADATSGFYAIASETTTFIQAGSATTLLNVQPLIRDSFTFDASGAITQVEAVRPDGSTKVLNTSPNTTFTELEAGYVLETFTKGHKSYFEVYHDGNGDGIYTSVAQGSGTAVDLIGLKAQIDATVDSLT